MKNSHSEHVGRLKKRVKELRAEGNYWRDEVLTLVDEEKRGSSDHNEALQNFWRARRELSEAQQKLRCHEE